MAQQTAIEWLIEQISEKQPNGFYVIDTLEDVKRIFDQAKQMEKEQIVKAYVEGINLVPCDLNSTDELDAEKYYHKTFGNQ